MLSVFPDLYTYEQLAPFLLRAVSGMLFLVYAVRVFKDMRAGGVQPHLFGSEKSGRAVHQIVAGVSGVAAIFLIIGLYMQVAALVLTILTAGRIGYLLGTKDREGRSIEYRVALLAIVVSLLFLGPGFWAFDYPL